MMVAGSDGSDRGGEARTSTCTAGLAGDMFELCHMVQLFFQVKVAVFIAEALDYL